MKPQSISDKLPSVTTFASALDQMVKGARSLPKQTKTKRQTAEKNGAKDKANGKPTQTLRNNQKPSAVIKPETKTTPLEPPVLLFSAIDAPDSVIHSFDGKDREAREGLFGFGKKRDTRFQVVQREVKFAKPNAKGEKSRWDVSVRPVKSGLVVQNMHVGSYTRRVTVDDFNDTSAPLTAKTNESIKKLHHSDNQLNQSTYLTKPDQPERWWADQQARNVGGGLSGALHATLSSVASIPENIVKAGSSIGNTSRTIANLMTGGAVGNSAFNPMVTDEHNKYYNAPTNVAASLNTSQAKFSKTLGSDQDSFTYNATQFIVPLLLTRGNNKAGRVAKTTNGSRVVLVRKEFENGIVNTIQTKKGSKVLSANPSKLPKMSSRVVKNFDVIGVIKRGDGTSVLTSNGRPMTQKQVVHAIEQGALATGDLSRANYTPAAIKKIVEAAAHRRPSTLAPEESNTAAATRFPRRSMTLQEVQAAVAEGVFPYKINPGFNSSLERRVNCLSCVQATEATLAGRPASALPLNKEAFVQPNVAPARRVREILRQALPEIQRPVTIVRDVSALRKSMSSAGLKPGDRGVVVCTRGGSANVKPSDGHIVNFIVRRNGVVEFLDSQIGSRAIFKNQNYTLLQWALTHTTPKIRP